MKIARFTCQGRTGYGVVADFLAEKRAEPVRIIVEEELEAVWADKKPAKEALDTAVLRGNAILPSALKAQFPL